MSPSSATTSPATIQRRPAFPTVPDSGVPRFIEAPVAAYYAALSALRGSRIFHPKGAAYAGSFVPGGHDGRTGVGLFDEPATHRAILRLSRATGLPEGVPDVLGLAVRLCDAHGPGRHQDFLLVTSANVPILHHWLLPAVNGFPGQTYSSLSTYSIGGRTRLVGAVPVAAARRRGRGSLPEVAELARSGTLAFDLALASLLGRWRPVGRLQVEEELPQSLSDDIRYSPWHTGGGIVPNGPLQGIRRAAYRGSQLGRGAV